MNRNFTENDILRIIYGEEKVEPRIVKSELDSNPDLRFFYNNVKHVHQHLDRLRLNPDHSSVEIILDHSGSFSSLEASH